MKGKVKFFNRSKGFGFITGDDGQDYFAGANALAAGTQMQDGMAVEFDASKNDRGLLALNIKAASASAGSSTSDEESEEDMADEEESLEEDDSEEESSEEEE